MLHRSVVQAVNGLVENLQSERRSLFLCFKQLLF